MRPFIIASFIVFLPLGASVATSCASGNPSSEDDSGGKGGKGTTLPGVGGGGIVVGGQCSPACGPEQKCAKSGGICLGTSECLREEDCGTGLQCDIANKTCVPGGECGDVLSSRIAPNLLFVIDRSCTMNQLSGEISKWSATVNAVTNLTASFESRMRFGVTMYPEASLAATTPATGFNTFTEAVRMQYCGIPMISVPLADANAGAVATLLQQPTSVPGNVCITPMDAGLAAASQVFQQPDPTRNNYVVLVTDGLPASCALNTPLTAPAGSNQTQKQQFSQGINQKAIENTTASIAEMNARNVKTFVIGFNAGADAATLNQFAEAGGVPNTADPAQKYYVAENQASLDAVLNNIAQQAVSCSIVLGKRPPDTNLIAFSVKGVSVPQDTTRTDGWDYDTTTNAVVAYGPVCQQVKSAEAADIKVSFDCERIGQR